MDEPRVRSEGGAPETRASATAAPADPPEDRAEEWNLIRFFQRGPGKKLAIWCAFFGLLYILRDFFSIIVLTFILSYIASTVVDRFEPLVPSRRALVLGVYVLFLGIIVVFCAISGPTIFAQGKNFIQEVNSFFRVSTAGAEDELEPGAEEVAATAPPSENAGAEASGGQVPKPDPAGRHVRVRLPPKVRELLLEYVPEENLRSLEEAEWAEERVAESVHWVVGATVQGVREMVALFISGVFKFFTSLLFSFLIVLGLPGLKKGVAELGRSRIEPIFREVAPSVASFASLLGKAFQAQTVIALLNCALTAVGMALLGIKLIGVLSAIVFVCSFIPVLGMIISTIPIALVALSTKGVGGVFAVMAMVAIVHALEAYVMNPFIYGHHLNIHPIVVLVILFTAEHLFGPWGLVLAIPCAAYIYEYIILGPDHSRTGSKLTRPAGPAPPSAPAPAPPPASEKNVTSVPVSG